jgi:hypothetical protein
MAIEQSAQNGQGEPLTLEEVQEELPSINGGSAVDNQPDDDDDDITVIVLEQGPEHGENDQFGLGWAEQDTPEMEERRRNVLLRELQRVQRASFIHFLILCLIPTSLLFIVIATVLGEDEECNSEATTCEKEDRTFINAFTTRCVCDAISIVTGEN